VLNAFRHQRCSHSRSGASWRASFTGAQRLSASEVFASCHRHNRPRGRGSAQRLSASEVFAYGYPRPPFSFRECSTPFGIRGVRIRRGLLGTLKERMCSTPFGIRGVRISESSGGESAGYCAQRLSATEVFAYNPRPCSPCITSMCSTPFGIRGVRIPGSRTRAACSFGVLNAFRHQRCSHVNCGCVQVAALKVLNAFRHQRCSHSQIRPMNERSVCAQRLSASEVFAFPVCRGQPDSE